MVSPYTDCSYYCHIISDINLCQSENFSINLMVYHPCLPHLMVYHPRPPQSMLRTFLLNPFGMKIFLAQNTIYKWDWIGFFLDPSYKESIQHWLWGAGKNNFWQNLNVYLNENVFDDLIFIYRMKIHFGKDILSLIVWKIWKTKLDRMFTDTPANYLFQK